MAKILITESVHPIGPELLTAAGHTVHLQDALVHHAVEHLVDGVRVPVLIRKPGQNLRPAHGLPGFPQQIQNIQFAFG